MTHFEYLSVAFSIVLSLAGVRLLSGLSVGVASERRYWPHALWIVGALLTSAMVWWNFWSFRDKQWHFFSFGFTLLVPASIYLQAVALVPETPGQVRSWEEHFFRARKRFFYSLACFFLTIASGSWLLLDFPLTHPARVFQALGLGLALGGALSDNRRLHWALPVIFVTLILLVSGVAFLRPGSMASFSSLWGSPFANSLTISLCRTRRFTSTGFASRREGPRCASAVRGARRGSSSPWSGRSQAFVATRNRTGSRSSPAATSNIFATTRLFSNGPG